MICSLCHRFHIFGQNVNEIERFLKIATPTHRTQNKMQLKRLIKLKYKVAYSPRIYHNSYFLHLLLLERRSGLCLIPQVVPTKVNAIAGCFTLSMIVVIV